MNDERLCLICGNEHPGRELELICDPCAVGAVRMKWISVKDSVPKHMRLVLVYTPKGQCLCILIDTIEMNKEWVVKGYPEEQVDPSKKPYYFCSQEIIGHVLTGVTHWMPLPEPPR